MHTIDQLIKGLADVEELILLAVEAEDAETFAEAETELVSLETKLDELEFQRMFSGAQAVAAGGCVAEAWSSGHAG